MIDIGNTYESKPVVERAMSKTEKNRLRDERAKARAYVKVADHSVSVAFRAKMEAEKAIIEAAAKRCESARLITGLFRHRKALGVLRAEIKRLGAEIKKRERELSEPRFKQSPAGAPSHDPTSIRFLGGSPVNPD